jgi:hypothetical protein
MSSECISSQITQIKIQAPNKIIGSTYESLGPRNET